MFFILFLFLSLSPLAAQNQTDAPEIVSKSAIMIDAQTGTIIYAKNIDEVIPPASLTKLMTMHLVMNDISAGRISLDTLVPIGKEAWAQSQPPRSSLMFLAPGQTVTVKEILLGLAVSSGNDAAVAAALICAPTVNDFVSMMNSEARHMWLQQTYFTEPAGISENNATTAREFAQFCRAYITLHPEMLSEFHSVPEFSYPTADNVAEAFKNDPKTITQSNRNGLLRTFSGTDGLKTGYIDEAGYNIAITTERNGTRFIAVILGAPAHPGGDRIRDDDGRRILSWAFDNYKTIVPVIEEIDPVRLWKGKENLAYLKLAHNDPLLVQPAAFTSPLNRSMSLDFQLEIPQPLIAPLPANAPVGWLVISDEQGEVHRAQLLSARTYAKGNVFKRLWHSIRLLFKKKQTNFLT